MIAPVRTAYTGPTTIEFGWKNGTMTHTIALPSTTVNCQGRPVAFRIIDTRTGTTSMSQGTITVNQATGLISWNTNSISIPFSINLMVQWFDRPY